MSGQRAPFLAAGDELASIETIKAILSVQSPVASTVRQVNESLEESPELVNEAPYGDGWLAIVEPRDWEADRANLLGAERYLEVMRRRPRKG